MLFPSNPISAIFLDRPNRFLGKVQIEENIVECFIPNPGRMRELLYPGVKVYLLKISRKHRKTYYDIVLVEHENILVSIDSRVPNRVLWEAIENRCLPEFRDLKVSKREPVFGNSRFDFLLEGGESRLMLEVKSCTLVEDGIALFPDAPTKRGTKHAKTLLDALSLGRSSIFFLIQRNDAFEFRPNKVMDPLFAEALRVAERAGVEVYAHISEVKLDGINLGESIPVILQR